MKGKKLKRLDTAHMVIFAMFGALMFGSKLIMESLPNVHTIAMFTVLLTVVYRSRALIPLYVYVFLDGLRWGFGVAWIPYVYIWLPLWLAVMFLPGNMSKKAAVPVYALISMLHGFLFGLMYAPAQSLIFGLDFKQTMAWVIAGLPCDLIHGAGNFAFGLLVYPLSLLIRKAESKICG